MILRLLFLLATASLSFGQLRISQIYGGGGNSGSNYKNDFIEIFNAGSSSASVNGFSVQYASVTGSTWQVTNLPNVTLLPGQYLLVQEAAQGGGTTNLPTPDATGNIPMSATAGKVALVNSITQLTGTCPTAGVLDFIGFGSTANCSETAPSPAPSNANAVLRGAGGCTDAGNNSTDFAAALPTPRNTASSLSPCAGSTNPSGSGAASPNSVNQGANTLLTVTVTPGGNPTSTGLTVTVNLSSIGGSATQSFFDNATNGDVTAGDNIFSFQATVPGATTTGLKSLAFTVADAQARSSNGAIAVTVTVPPQVLSINQIQGSGAASPVVGQTVQTSGIVTLLKTNGFYLQTPDALIDSDPNTSEGIFVFTTSGPPLAAAVGNSVLVQGVVTEFKSSSQGSEDPSSLTEITGPAVTLVSTGNPLPAPIVLSGASINPTLGFGQLERFESMRVSMASLTATSPTNGNISEANATSTSDGRFHAVPTGVARPFREAGIQLGIPLPLPGIPRWDGNLEMYEVNFNMPGDTPLDVTSNAVVSNFVGVLDYFSPNYVLNHDRFTTATATGLISAVPVSGAQPGELAIAGFNIERFYDTVDDAGTSDVVLTQTAFDKRLNKLSLAVRNVLKFPDVISFEEAEKLTVLEAIAAKINSDAIAAGQPVPNYASFLSEGNDIGGIDVGFLVKSNVTVNSVTQLGKTTTYTDPSTGNPAILFDRPPLLADVTVQQPGSDSGLNLKILSNHLRSLNGVDTQDAGGNRIRVKRATGAEGVAAILQGLQGPTANVLTLGDFNAFEFNDGYGDIMGTIKGLTAGAAQVQVASPDLVTPDFINLMETRLPANNRYSYNFVGNAQVLDHILVNNTLNARVKRVEVARNDSDFPEIYRSDANRPERISDHDIPVVYIALPNEVTSKTSVTRSGLALNRATQVYSGTVTVTNTSASALPGPIYVFLNGLAGNVTVQNAAGTSNGAPYLSSAFGLAPGANVTIPVQFKLSSPGTITYTTKVFAGTF